MANVHIVFNKLDGVSHDEIRKVKLNLGMSTLVSI